MQFPAGVLVSVVSQPFSSGGPFSNQAPIERGFRSSRRRSIGLLRRAAVCFYPFHDGVRQDLSSTLYDCAYGRRTIDITFLGNVFPLDAISRLKADVALKFDFPQVLFDLRALSVKLA